MKEFCVIGLGNFGAMVARQLAEMGARVTAIDNDKSKVQTAQEFVYLAIMGDATDRKFLENLEVGNFSSFVVSTGEDSHASILISLYLKELGAKKITVKANSRDHARILKKVGADEAVIPEEEMAVKVAHALARPNVVDFLPLSEEYSIAEVVVPESFVGKSLMKLKLRQKHHIDVIAIKDNATGVFYFIPEALYEIKKSDILIVLGKQADIEKLRG
jgi:trk system potassium uptake protein TrkA